LFPLTKQVLGNAQQLQLALNTDSQHTQLHIQHEQAQQEPQTVYLIDAGKVHKPLQTLVLDWEGEDGQLITIEVLSSDNLKDWQSMGQGVVLKTATGQQSILQNTIQMMTASHARYYQLVPMLKAGASFRLKLVQAQYQKVVALSRHTLWQDLKWLKREQGKNGQVNIEYEALGHYPASYLNVVLPDDNTIAQVKVFARNSTQAPWQWVSSASLYRILKQGNAFSNPDIQISQKEARYWRLQFDQSGGGVGQRNPKLRLGWRPHTVVWNARGQGPYVLKVGQPVTPMNTLVLSDLMPDYTLETLKLLPTSTLRSIDPTPVSVGSTWVSPPDYKRWLLWAGLLIGVAVLIGMAWSLFKTTKSS
jgi:hypothetical protein